MDIDDPPGHLPAHFIRQDLHIAGKDDKICAGFFDDGHLAGFGLGFVLFGHTDMVERNVVVDNNFLIIEMIGDNGNDINRQRPDSPPI